MVQRGGGLGFLHEAALALGVSYLVGGQRLDRNDAIQARVAGLPDGSHATFAELVDDLVMR